MRHFAFIPLVFLVLSTHAQITSTFDVDADGWTLSDNNNNDPQTVNYFSSGGNPGGYVSATKTSSSQPYFWTSPSKFGGNIAYFCYGQNLSFDLQVDHVATIHGAAGDVHIKTPSGSILALNLATFPAQAPAWSTFTVRLDETAGWRVGSIGGPVATKAQMIQYLSGLSSIRINIKYNSGVSTFTGAIDNVILNQRTVLASPSISSLSAIAGNPGSSITINGTNFDPTPANNVVYFGGVPGTVTNATATSLTVTIPNGAQYGQLMVINKTTGLSKLTEQPFTPTFNDGGRIIPASFNPKFDILITGGYGGVSIADMDGDGWNDLVVARDDNTGIWIYRNLGAGGTLSLSSFDAAVSFPTGLSGTNGSGLKVIDFDNDGMLDMVTSGWTGGPGVFATFRNTSTPGTLSFEAVEYWSGRSDESPVYNAVDIDGDGLPELISGEGSGGAGQNVWITQNMSTPGNIEFGYSILYFSATLDDAPSSATIRDLNNDGKPEFILVRSFGGIFTVFTNTSTPGSISFGTNFSITEGIGGAINVADFNGDGKNDLAWKNGFSNDDVHIRLNTDTDGLLTDTDFATEIILDSEVSTYGALSIADINGDNKPDILATDNADVGIFENVFSGGAFSSSAFVPGYRFQGSGGSTYPATAMAADLNGDNKPDIVVGITNTSPDRLSIYENKNVHAPVISVNTVSPLTGSVGSTVTITGNNFSPVPAENEVYFGAVKANVITATATQLEATVPVGTTYAAVSVRKGELTSRYRLPFVTTFSPGVTFDNTHFAPPVNFTLTNANYDIEVADLNRDGKPDILAEGSGGFAFRNTHTAGAISTSSLVADDTLSAGSFINPRLEDFDGDGLPDAAAVNGLTHKNNSTLTEITFYPSTSLGIGASNMDIADFNADGKMDMVITADASGLNDLQIIENRTANLTGNFTTGTYGSFSQEIFYTKPAPNGGVIAEDFDEDGFADIVTTNPTTDNISIYQNLGILKISAAQFAARVDLAVGDSPGRIYKGDFDGDGKVDLMLYHGGTNSTLLTVFHNTSTIGNISFNRIDLTNPSATTVATIADLDGDGKPEIITTSETGNRFSIFKNTHTSGALTAASFTTPFNTTVAAPRGITTGDLNLDGKPEIILTRAAGLLEVYENLVSLTQNFITQWNLSMAGSGTTQLSFGTATSGTVNYAWQELSPGAATGGGSWSGTILNITGLPAGATIRLQIAPTNFQRINASGTDDNRLIQIEQWGTTAWTSMQNAFRGCTNLQVTASDVPDLSGVTDMSSMFESCNNLNSPSNIGTWNTATVTNMTFMFYDATSFNQDIGAWNTSAVTNMSTMFSEALAFNQDIGSWNTAAVTDMSDMFGYAAAFNQDIGSWNTGAVTDMSFMFRQASAFNHDISSWNTAAVTDMRSMFRLTVAFNQNIGAWTLNPTVDVRNIFDDSGMDCNNYSSTLIGWSANPFTPNGRTLGAIGRQYGTNAVAARTNLVSTKSWTITGDTPSGVACSSVLLPTITNFTPTSGSVGTTVNITGTNFDTTPTNNTVAFNGTTSAVTTSTATSITTTVPAGATTGKISVTVAGNTATSSTDFTVTTVTNQPPIILSTTTAAPIDGIVTVELLSLISDPDDNLDLSTLALLSSTSEQGAAAGINASSELELDYGAVFFVGTDRVSIEVCDLLSACSQQVLSIEVSGDVIVYNALSPGDDQQNQIFKIEYIDIIPKTQQNKVTIYNRWGDVVWEGVDYDNSSVVFDGTSTDGKELPSGTYFYKIEFTGGREPKAGFLSLKR